MSTDEKKKNSLVDSIYAGLENLVTLEIITAVGKVQFEDADGQKQAGLPDLDYSKDPKVILTKIDLLQGDITNVIDPEFVGDDYKGLRDFHANVQQEGSQIIKNNIAALKELYNLAKSWNK